MESHSMFQLEKTSDQLKLLADKSRLHLLALLLHSELCVCDLVELSDLSQPNVSQHMRKLKFGGLVTESRKGQWVYYALSDQLPTFIRDILEQLPSLKEQVGALKASAADCCIVEPAEIGGSRAEKISS